MRMIQGDDMSLEIVYSVGGVHPDKDTFVENAKNAAITLGLYEFTYQGASPLSFDPPTLSVRFKGQGTDRLTNKIDFADLFLFLKDSRGFEFFRKIEEGR